jgi:hypothetical protein
MTPRTLTRTPELTEARYTCTVCSAHWRYDEVRHVLCCPECAGGLWRHQAVEPSQAPAPQRSGRSG